MQFRCVKCGSYNISGNFIVGRPGELGIYGRCLECETYLHIYKSDREGFVVRGQFDGWSMPLSDRLIAWSHRVTEKVIMADWDRVCVSNSIRLKVSPDGRLCAVQNLRIIEEYRSWKHAREEFPKFAEKKERSK